MVNSTNKEANQTPYKCISEEQYDSFLSAAFSLVALIFISTIMPDKPLFWGVVKIVSLGILGFNCLKSLRKALKPFVIPVTEQSPKSKND